MNLLGWITSRPWRSALLRKDCYLNKSCGPACPHLKEVIILAQVIGLKYLEAGTLYCLRVWLGHSLPSQKQTYVNQIANLDYRSKTLIYSSFSFFENGPDLELEKDVWKRAELYLLNYVFLEYSANYSVFDYVWPCQGWVSLVIKFPWVALN